MLGPNPVELNRSAEGLYAHGQAYAKKSKPIISPEKRLLIIYLSQIAAMITTLVIAILVMKGNMSLTSASSIMLGSSAFGAALFIYTRIQTEKPWRATALAVVLLFLPAILGGSLGLGGVLNGHQLGWTYFGGLIAFASILLSSGCYQAGSTLYRNHPKILLQNIQADNTIPQNLKNNLTRENLRENLHEMLLNLAKQDEQLMNYINSNPSLTARFNDTTSLKDIKQLIKEDPNFASEIQNFLNKHPSIKDLADILIRLPNR